MTQQTYTGTDMFRDDAAPTKAFWSRVAWGPVLAGAVAAIGAQLLFTVLGMAIGFASVNAWEAQYSTTPREVGVAAGAWWIVSGTVALLIGGLVLGRLAGLPRSGQLHLHAFTMWAVTAIFGFAVLWSGASMASTTAAATAAAVGGANVTTYGSANADRAGVAGRTAGDAVAAVTGGASRTGLTTADAEEARRTARTTAWWSVIALVLGIVASLAGAWFTGPRDVPTRARVPG
jgi:hypothetical protein